MSHRHMSALRWQLLEPQEGRHLGLLQQQDLGRLGRLKLVGRSGFAVASARAALLRPATPAAPSKHKQDLTRKHRFNRTDEAHIRILSGCLILGEWGGRGGRCLFGVLPGVLGSSFPPPVSLEPHGLCRRQPSELQPVRKRREAGSGCWVTEPSLDGIPQCSARAVTFQAGESLHPKNHKTGAAKQGPGVAKGLASGRVPRSDKAARITRLCSEPPNPKAGDEARGRRRPCRVAAGLCRWEP